MSNEDYYSQHPPQGGYSSPPATAYNPPNSYQQYDGHGPYGGYASATYSQSSFNSPQPNAYNQLAAPTRHDTYGDRPPSEHSTRQYQYEETRGYPYPPPAPSASYGDYDSRYDNPYEDDRKEKRRDGKHEGEKSLGATLLGAAGGGVLGHELGNGPLATIGGVIAGAIGANVLEKQHEK
ncbi:MAG: hypothetical protein M1834_007457 [Cirrosporium novae-zelandiae]|nr:MAG: hypothetical protein M1834_007457 [Cirrosporium novae-zelandiae]